MPEEPGKLLYPFIAMGMAMTFAPFWPFLLLAAMTPPVPPPDPSIRCNECRQLNAKRSRQFLRVVGSEQSK